jgi:HAD superfamily hydrolase (TIGR01509 family)
MHIEVVLFDLGGVLVELGGMGDMANFSAEENEDEIWRRWLTCPWVRRFERGGCEPTSFAEGMVESWSMPVAPETFLEAFASWPKGLLPGAMELVHSVRAKKRVSCLSNSNAIHTERGWAEFGIYELFDGLYFSHEIGLIKPDRNIFDHVIRDLGCPAEQILFLDDNQINVDAARAAGLLAERAVGVPQARSILEDKKVLARDPHLGSGP